MTFAQVLKDFQGELYPALEEFLASLEPAATAIGGESSRDAFQVIRSFTLRGGKRLRPWLLCLAYEGYGGSERSKILRAAASIELMQSFLLMHDDIMDRSEVRRGAPAVHKQFEELYRSRDPADLPHFGEALAILAGDITIAYGGMAIASSGLAPERIARALGLYCAIVADEGYGQILDMESATRPLAEDEALAVIHYKTTRYTVEGPLHMGAVLAGAPEAELERLSDFATPLGYAFQLQDDVLGLFGDEDKTGKPADSDLKEGKQTLLVIKALERATASQRETLRRCLGNPALSRHDVANARDIVRATGALDHCEGRIRQWVTEAKEALTACGLNARVRVLLVRFADYLVAREF